MSIKYTDAHEWLRDEPEGALMGITAFASEQLGDVIFVELPAIGQRVTKGEPIAVVESSKAASDVYAPASGEIIAVNEKLADAPELVNEEPESGGWFCRIKLDGGGAPAELMDEAAYAAFTQELERKR